MPRGSRQPGILASGKIDREILFVWWAVIEGAVFLSESAVYTIATWNNFPQFADKIP